MITTARLAKAVFGHEPSIKEISAVIEAEHALVKALRSTDEIPEKVIRAYKEYFNDSKSTHKA